MFRIINLPNGIRLALDLFNRISCYLNENDEILLSEGISTCPHIQDIHLDKHPWKRDELFLLKDLKESLRKALLKNLFAFYAK